MTAETPAAPATGPVPLQPLLHAETLVFSTPTQAWSSASGEMGEAFIHGVYHSDTRVLSGLKLVVGGLPAEHIASHADGASTRSFVSLLRHLGRSIPGGNGADPKVRLDRKRTVTPGTISEMLTFSSALSEPIQTTVSLVAESDFSPMFIVKAGIVQKNPALRALLDDGSIRWSAGPVSATLDAPGAIVSLNGDDHGTAGWSITIPAHGSVSLSWSLAMQDESAVATGVTGPSEWADFSLRTSDPRLARWVDSALADLDALRLVSTHAPDDAFLAAGAPWFFTLFGRDSIWAARFLLPLGTRIAASTLRALAAVQGTREVAETAEQPGKIMHELRPAAIEIPGEDVVLPPLYYGTVDATALWIVLLHDAWRWGMPEAEVAALMPNLEAALAWMRDYGDSDGDGFLEYVDTTGHGLANQGWKDSGDSIQWRDGRLAEGPIALCEVQGYAYEAAIGGAALLEHFGRPGASEWRGWAARLKARFAGSFWIESPEGRYPAVALDVHKHRVDTATSNIGHLLGTGILSAEDARFVAARLVSPSLNSGFGLRTMSTDSAGYWPLSYHGGSVWAHDTAIAIAGLGREGFGAEASSLIEGLLAAADGFDYRMPELHSGDARMGRDGAETGAVGAPVPYPAACRPQAWSAAAAISVLATTLGLEPRNGELTTAPIVPSPAGSIDADGLRFATRPFAISTDAAGTLLRSTLRG